MCSNLVEGYKTFRAACKEKDIFQQNCVFGIDAPAVVKDDDDNDDEPFPLHCRERRFVCLNNYISTMKKAYRIGSISNDSDQ